MNIKRQRLLAAKKQYKQPVTPFVPIDLTTAKFVPKGMTRAFQNTRYTVMIYDNCEAQTELCLCPAIRVMIQKHNDTPIINHLSELQKIKNEIFGPEVTAVEYYPAESELVNDHNIYWLWIFPGGGLPIPIL